MLGWLSRQTNRYRRGAINRLAVRRVRRREAAWHQIASGPPQLVTVQTLNGRLTFDSRDSIIGQTLFRERNWEIGLIQRTTDVLRAHGLMDPSRATLVDAGANIGSTTIAFLKQGVFERAIAVEPEHANFGLLERNVRQNRLAERVHCVELALGAESGEVQLELSPENFGDHRVRVGTAEGEFHEVERQTRVVKMERLDDVLGRELGSDIDTVGLLWIDVQGFEGHILRGASQLLDRGTPVEMELWPYGLSRAGTSREAFIDLVTTRFEQVVDLRDPTLGAHPIGRIEDLYDAQVGPLADTEILLFGRT